MPRLFGVEHEQFVLHDDGSAPSHEEIDSLYRSLQSAGFRPSAVDREGRCLAVGRTTDWGELVVSTDCCTHILEFSFPPFAELSDFRRMYAELAERCTAVLAELGLRFVPGAARQPPNPILWRAKAKDPDGTRLQEDIRRPRLNHRLFVAELPAWIAATQVSLNIARSEAIARLAYFYQFEPLVPMLFGNSPEMRGVRGRCLRPLSWLANFPDDFPLCGVPRSLPASWDEYERRRAECRGRDFSFTAIRGPERVEFRSACSQPTLDDIEQLVRFRQAVDRLASDAEAVAPGELRRRFVEACLHGPDARCAALWQRVIEIEPSLAERSVRL